MDANLKAKWVEALRSGNYRQTQGTLRDGESFCCLGVLCDLTGRGQWVDGQASAERPNVRRFRVDGETQSSRVFLPLSIASECHFNDALLGEIMDMNDRGESFKTIADYIEANIPAYQPLAPGEG